MANHVPLFLPLMANYTGSHCHLTESPFGLICTAEQWCLMRYCILLVSLAAGLYL